MIVFNGRARTILGILIVSVAGIEFYYEKELLMHELGTKYGLRVGALPA